jgi:3-oxoacyl-(acyl-carrier-protein) synthase
VDCVPGRARIHPSSITLTNSAGIGGNNASLVLSLPEKAMAGSLAPADENQIIHISEMGWVLPENVGNGNELLQQPEWLQWTDGANGKLATFNAKAYLKSVKGYLDPSGAMLLAAMGLASTAASSDGLTDRKGIVTQTHYGATTSAFAFFKQLVEKGPRLASPMVFPHGYANTPGNLTAIESGYAGPHMVFYGLQDLREAVEFAASRLLDRTADDMLCGFYEAVNPDALPDGRHILNGAIALRLSLQSSGHDVGAFSLAALRALPPVNPVEGVIAAFPQLLKAMHP